MIEPAPDDRGSPTTGRPTVLLVIPCYNEADRLPVDRFEAFAARAADIAFLFVDDGSTDATRDVLDAVVRRRPERFLSMSLPDNQGKGEAVRRGILKGMELEPEYIGFWDADLSTPLEEVPRFVSLYQDKPDRLLLAGARVKMMGREIERRAVRHYLGRAFATVASLLLDIHMYDTQCGAKLLRCRPGTRALFEQPFHSSWLFDLEMLLRMRRQAGTALDTLVYEVPLNTWRDVPESKVRSWHFLRAVLDLAWLRLKYMT